MSVGMPSDSFLVALKVTQSEIVKGDVPVETNVSWLLGHCKAFVWLLYLSPSPTKRWKKVSEFDL